MTTDLYRDLHRDELRRELRAVEAANREAVPAWRSLLHRVFSGDTSATSEVKAELLGVPTRRGFFRIGGTAIAGAALLAACGDEDDDNDAAPGQPAGAGRQLTGATESDLVLAQTAISLEILAIDAYQAAIDSGLVSNAAVGEAAALFQEHHMEHRDALAGVVSSFGADPVSDANEAVRDAAVTPVLEDPELDEIKIIQLAFDLEDAAAKTYVYAATQFSEPGIRSVSMTIGGVENRHRTILGAVLELANDRLYPAFVSSANPLPEGAVLDG